MPALTLLMVLLVLLAVAAFILNDGTMSSGLKTFVDGDAVAVVSNVESISFFANRKLFSHFLNLSSKFFYLLNFINFT